MKLYPQALFLALSLAVFGAGCAVSVTPAPSAVGSSSGSASSTWTNVAPHVDKLSYQDTSGVQAVMYRVAAHALRWQFVASSTPRTVGEWSDALPQAVLVANGVYFTPENAPAGFLSIHGQRIGSQSFDLDKSALLSLSPEPQLVDTAHEHASFASIQDGAQSYPLLVRDGESIVSSTSTLAARRTFIGLDREQNVYVGVIPGSLVTLTQLSQLLVRTGIDWQDVLNLDGGPSSGIEVRGPVGTDLLDSETNVPIVLVAQP
ncbi:MAG: phosphodiester glycosidase family protein [Patescibacteria group bacterium]